MFLGLGALFALVSLTSPRWAGLIWNTFPQPGGAAPAAAPAPAPSPGSRPREEKAESRISVKLFFVSPDHPVLVAEERSVRFSRDLPQQITHVLEELIEGSRQGLVPPLPARTRVRDVFLTPEGTAYVDLSLKPGEPEPAEVADAAGEVPTASPTATPAPGAARTAEASDGVQGSMGELLAVYAVVDSVTVNFPSVRRVQILLDDRPAETLAGHVDLTRPLRPDMTYVAFGEPLAPASPSASPSGAPRPGDAPRGPS